MRKIVITGAGSGAGKVAALACAQAGFFIIAADKDKSGLQQLQSLLAPHRLETHLADFSKPETYKTFISNLYSVHNHRSLLALVNNASLHHSNSASGRNNREVSEVCDASLDSLIHLCTDFARNELQAQHARSIINITAAPHDTADLGAPYRKIKAGVIDLTKANAWNLAPRIRVNVVSPTRVRSPSVLDLAHPHAGRKIERQDGINDPVEPGSMADVIMYLLSDQSRHLTGKLIAVDNGACPH